MVEVRLVLPAGVRCSAAIAGGCLAVVATLPLGARASAYSDLSAMSFEELANVEITSVSKKQQRMSDAAASVFVITSADIGRSGATSLPEALRLAPNLQVEVSLTGTNLLDARHPEFGRAADRSEFERTVLLKMLWQL